MIADKDKEIEQLKVDKDTLSAQATINEKTIEEMRGFVSERDKTIEENGKIINAQKDEIEALKKQVKDLKAEVKELSGDPAPMVDENAGIPAGNGTGDAPKQKASRIQRGMSYQQIRQAMAEEK